MSGLAATTTATTAGAEQSGNVIAFTIEALTVGGAERMLLAMANEFVRLGWQVHVVCLTKPGEIVAELHEDVTLHLLSKRPGFDISLPLRLYRCIRTINPICVNSHLWTANTWTRSALFFSRFKVVVTEHSRDTWKPWYFRTIDKILSRRTAALVTVSGDTADFYRQDIGLDDALIRVINNGVDTQQYASGSGAQLRAEWLSAKSGLNEKERTPIILGTVGRIVPAKNHTRLIDALHLLVQDPELQHLFILLVVVGEGSEQGAIADYVKELGLDGNVIFTGTRHDIPDVLAAFDLFVLSSDREGHPLTALEAQAAGTPVVLTDAGGSSEAIARMGDQLGGLLVERSSEALAQAMREMIVDPELRQQRSAFARTFALANFDKRQMVERYVSLFVSVGL